MTLPEVGSTVYGNGQRYTVLEAVEAPTAGRGPVVTLLVRRPNGSKQYVASYHGATIYGDRWCVIQGPANGIALATPSEVTK